MAPRCRARARARNAGAAGRPDPGLDPDGGRMSETVSALASVGSEAVTEQAGRWLEIGHGVAVATVIRTWGSSPRPTGSQLAVNEEMAFVGSVSGGCVEG